MSHVYLTVTWRYFLLSRLHIRSIILHSTGISALIRQSLLRLAATLRSSLKICFPFTSSYENTTYSHTFSDSNLRGISRFAGLLLVEIRLLPHSCRDLRGDLYTELKIKGFYRKLSVGTNPAVLLEVRDSYVADPSTGLSYAIKTQLKAPWVHQFGTNTWYLSMILSISHHVDDKFQCLTVVISSEKLIHWNFL